MKISSIFLAAVMIFALAGQAAEARDHHGWRDNDHHRSWNNGNWNNGNWNNGQRMGWNRGWGNNRRNRYQAWNNGYSRHDMRELNKRMSSRRYY